jgi:thiol-disulfide isomerase/thioredoxin
MMSKAADLVLKILGVVLLVSAVLKGHQLLTQPLPDNDIWSWRLFLIFQVEFELVLSIWLLSSIFKKAAWLVSLLCFAVFSCITFYKGFAGAESCGCFGVVHVNPWITFLVIDMPSVILLSIFRPKQIDILRPLSILRPYPSRMKLIAVFSFIFIALAVTTPMLILNEPPKVTVKYEVLEPEMWEGVRLPILDKIDISDQLEKGDWVVLLYHFDCPDCAKAIPEYEQMAYDLAGNGDFLKFAFVEIPPFGKGPIDENAPCVSGRMSEDKQWLVTTPVVILMSDSKVIFAWEYDPPDLDTIFEKLMANDSFSTSAFVIN